MLTQLRAIYDRSDKTEAVALTITFCAFRILEFQAVAGRIHQEAVVEWDARQVRLIVFNSCQMSYVPLHFIAFFLLQAPFQARAALTEARTRGGDYGVTEEAENRLDF